MRAAVGPSPWFATKKFGFLLPAFVATIPALAYALARTGLPSNVAAWLTVLVVFVLVPVADWLVGRDEANPADDESLALSRDPFYRALLLACVPVQLVSVAFGAWAFAHWDLGAAARLGWILSIGTVTGAIAINVAHELVHRSSRVDQWAGGVMLATACYGGFKVEHIRCHHVHVATPLDSTTARRGQCVYAFVAFALAHNFRKAWRLETERLARLGLSPLHWRNELLWWYGLSAAIAAALGVALGLTGLTFFLAQGLFGVCLLEVVNYIEHYGLERERNADGRYEPVGTAHSWNSSFLLTNLLLFQLQRHPDHHRYARRPYQILRHAPDAPQLPAGYATMILAALVPPLWQRIMDPRLPAGRPEAARGP